MGVETARALQARRRETAARIERLIATAAQRDPTNAARQSRIGDARRQARSRLRALATAQRAVTAIEVEVGEVLMRMVDEDLSRNDAFKLAGLERHLGRKYAALAEAARLRLRAGSSTDLVADDGPTPDPGHLGPEGTRPDVTDGRNP